MNRPCLDCGAITTSSRCSACRRATERARVRPTTSERGYGPAHQRARAALIAHLPMPCFVCGKTLRTATEMVAAHRIDGDPSAGWVPTHRACNERMKGRLEP